LRYRRLQRSHLSPCVAKDGRSEKLPQSKSEILPAPSEMEPKRKAVDFRQPLNGEKIVN